MNSKTFEYENNVYQFSIDFDRVKGWHNFTVINITSGKKRSVKILNNDNFVVKINKNSISAAGGVRGLFSFLNDALTNNFMNSWCNVIVKHFPA